MSDMKDELCGSPGMGVTCDKKKGHKGRCRFTVPREAFDVGSDENYLCNVVDPKTLAKCQKVKNHDGSHLTFRDLLNVLDATRQEW